MNRLSDPQCQITLILRLLPLLNKSGDFALKGGTAINLFIREMPRYSIDIDLVFVPTIPYRIAAKRIKSALEEICIAAEREIIEIDRSYSFPKSSKFYRQMIRTKDCNVIIEVSPVLRGTVWPIEVRTVSDIVMKNFGPAETRVASFYDLYAGKICAALDRQNIRDIFDIKILLDKDSVDRKLIETFLVYLIGHRRPMSELLDPHLKAITSRMVNDLNLLTLIRVSVDDLIEARDSLIDIVRTSFTDSDREFLLSVERMQPDWSLLSIAGVEHLPAVKWKQANLRKMTKRKHAREVTRLRRVLDKF